MCAKVMATFSQAFHPHFWKDYLLSAALPGHAVIGGIHHRTLQV